MRRKIGYINSMFGSQVYVENESIPDGVILPFLPDEWLLIVDLQSLLYMEERLLTDKMILRRNPNATTGSGIGSDDCRTIQRHNPNMLQVH